jgi:hypothetical protein
MRMRRVKDPATSMEETNTTGRPRLLVGCPALLCSARPFSTVEIMPAQPCSDLLFHGGTALRPSLLVLRARTHEANEGRRMHKNIGHSSPRRKATDEGGCMAPVNKTLGFVQPHDKTKCPLTKVMTHDRPGSCLLDQETGGG